VNDTRCLMGGVGAVLDIVLSISSERLNVSHYILKQPFRAVEGRDANPESPQMLRVSRPAAADSIPWSQQEEAVHE